MIIILRHRIVSSPDTWKQLIAAQQKKNDVCIYVSINRQKCETILNKEKKAFIYILFFGIMKASVIADRKELTL